mmetsp:Transcript_45340/g.83913  ORF Transcript_45340/g.83913 Transcript_45340/m.83913 type:complete len:240 (-) Transcript_45340:27-746(-)
MTLASDSVRQPIANGAGAGTGAAFALAAAYAAGPERPPREDRRRQAQHVQFREDVERARGRWRRRRRRFRFRFRFRRRFVQGDVVGIFHFFFFLFSLLAGGTLVASILLVFTVVGLGVGSGGGGVRLGLGAFPLVLQYDLDHPTDALDHLGLVAGTHGDDEGLEEGRRRRGPVRRRRRRRRQRGIAGSAPRSASESEPLPSVDAGGGRDLVPSSPLLSQRKGHLPLPELVPGGLLGHPD